jgi:hypothetical protein
VFHGEAARSKPGFKGNVRTLHLCDESHDGRKTPFLRCLSVFHGWLPFLLLFLVKRLRYDRRALVVWTVLAWVLCLVCFFFMPEPDTPPGVIRSG